MAGNKNGLLSVGVIGCGYWGSKHVRVLRSVVGVGEVVAVDRDQGILQAMTDAHPGVSTCTSFEEAIKRVDAVIIATPPSTHAPLALAALRAGCHVMAEKPMATTSAEAQELINVAESAFLTLMAGHTFEYNPAVWKLRELIQSGELGKIYHINTARLNLGLYQSDVNVIWDLAPHDVSILNYILGSQPNRVMAWARPHAHEQLEDVAYLRLDYDEIGVSSQVHVSWLDPCKVRKVTVAGSRKMAVYCDLTVDERIKVFDKGVAFEPDESMVPGPPSYHHGGIESPYNDLEEPLKLEGEEYIRSILTGERPRSDGRSGLAVVRVLEAAERSLSLGQPVEIEAASLSAQVA
jgi:predicted dehydrogenase